MKQHHQCFNSSMKDNVKIKITIIKNIPCLQIQYNKAQFISFNPPK